MSKIKKFIPAAVVIIVIAAVGYFIWQRGASNNDQVDKVTVDNSNIILFYGRECPHCHDAEKYIADHQLDQKVKFSKLEVWHDKANANLLSEKAKECNIKKDEVGVPFLWADGKCYEGVNQVENYLDSAAQSGSNKQ